MGGFLKYQRVSRQDNRMNNSMIRLLLVTAGCIGIAALALAQSAGPIAASDETQVATFHAEGAQIYDCKLASDGKLAWQFREPIATLMSNGKTVGRHYAGPNWEYADGSAVTGKAVANSPGATPADIPLLKLDVTARRGNGLLSDVTTVLRVNTRGGALTGACDEAGRYQSVPYAADYVFLRKAS
jgi:hypothetical protein